MAEFIEARCAVCRLADGLVVNIIIAFPSDLPQDECELIEIMMNQRCDIGWYWDGLNFNPPLIEGV